MGCVDKFYLEVLEDINKPEADLYIIIPRAIIRLIDKTDFLEKTDAFAVRLKNLNKILRKIPKCAKDLMSVKNEKSNREK